MEAERLAAREQGLNEGQSTGLKEGIKEEKYNTVVNMLKENYKIEEIIKITGLNKEEIIKIKETL